MALAADAPNALLYACRTRRIACYVRSPWIFVRCSLLNAHRWETVRVGAEKGKECRDCKTRRFDNPESETQDKIQPVAGGGAGGL